DPARVPEALDAVAALIARTAGGRVAPGIVEDAPGTKALAPPTIRLRPRRVISLLGARVARAEIVRSLRALGAACRTQRDALLVTPPSFRGDLRLEEDLVEEVARVGGYDRIPVTLPEVLLAAGEDTPARRLAARVRQALAAAGLAEMVTLAFTDTETNRRLPGVVGRALAPLAVKNPLSSETGELRRSPRAGPPGRSSSSTPARRLWSSATGHPSAWPGPSTPRSRNPLIFQGKCGRRSLTSRHSLTMFPATSR